MLPLVNQNIKECDDFYIKLLKMYNVVSVILSFERF